MKLGRVQGALITLLWFGALPAQAWAEWFFLKWMERPAHNGPSSLAKPEDRVEFQQVLSFDKQKLDDDGWPAARQALKEGDVIAYWKVPWEARMGILFKLQVNTLAYRLFKYGHIAIVVTDPDNEGTLRLLTSYPFTGPTIQEDLDTLKNESWDAYRLNQWDRVDNKRFYEFIRLVRKNAEKWYGYDLFGLMGLWNSSLQPNQPREIGYRYLCSTLIAAALHYAGVKLDVSPRYGVADIVTPFQPVSSKGWVLSQPRIVDRPSDGEGEEKPILEMNQTGDWADAEYSD